MPLEYIFFLNYKCASMLTCQVVDQAKIALILVQNKICKIEVTSFRNTKNSKNHHVKRTFQFYSDKFFSKNDNTLLFIKFRRNFEFFSQNPLNKILVIALVNLIVIVWMESKIQGLQLLFVHNFQNILPNSIL